MKMFLKAEDTKVPLLLVIHSLLVQTGSSYKAGRYGKAERLANAVIGMDRKTGVLAMRWRFYCLGRTVQCGKICMFHRHGKQDWNVSCTCDLFVEHMMGSLGHCFLSLQIFVGWKPA